MTRSRNLATLAGDRPASNPVHEAVVRLMRQLAKLTVHPCVKGPFHDAMQAKLEQLAHTRSNEVTSLDFGGIASCLLAAEFAELPSFPSRSATAGPRHG